VEGRGSGPVVRPGGAGELVELSPGGEDDEGDLGVAEDGELEGLLEQAVAALGEGDLAAGGVLNPPQLRLPPHHLRRAEWVFGSCGGRETTIALVSELGAGQKVETRGRGIWGRERETHQKWQGWSGSGGAGGGRRGNEEKEKGSVRACVRRGLLAGSRRCCLATPHHLSLSLSSASLLP
jgi:hypothetical protein